MPAAGAPPRAHRARHRGCALAAPCARPPPGSRRGPARRSPASRAAARACRTPASWSRGEPAEAARRRERELGSPRCVAVGHVRPARRRARPRAAARHGVPRQLIVEARARLEHRRPLRVHERVHQARQLGRLGAGRGVPEPHVDVLRRPAPARSRSPPRCPSTCPGTPRRSPIRRTAAGAACRGRGRSPARRPCRRRPPSRCSVTTVERPVIRNSSPRLFGSTMRPPSTRASPTGRPPTGRRGRCRPRPRSRAPRDRWPGRSRPPSR